MAASGFLASSPTLCVDVFLSRVLRGSGLLLQNPRHHIPLHQLARLIEVVVRDRVRVDAKRMINRRQELTRMDGAFERSGRSRVTAAMDMAATNTGAGDDAGVAVRPVIATIGAVGVA
jgi:hypothetical protein